MKNRSRAGASLTSTVFCRFRDIPRRKFFVFNKSCGRAKIVTNVINILLDLTNGYAIYSVLCTSAELEKRIRERPTTIISWSSP